MNKLIHKTFIYCVGLNEQLFSVDEWLSVAGVRINASAVDAHADARPQVSLFGV